MRPGPPPEAVYYCAAATISAQRDRGRDVALLCQGGPLLYVSFIGLFTRLAREFPVEIVLGVSSLTAGAAAGLPLATRGETLTVVPATLDEPALSDRILAAETVVVVKLGRHLAKLQQTLRRLGLLDDAIYVERATMPNQRTARLAEIEAGAAPYFSMAIVHRPAPSG
jgi:precorrin-2/cobalt-factor-2 C20-methyltransferase